MKTGTVWIWLLSVILLGSANGILNGQIQHPGKPLGLNRQLNAAEVMYVLPPVDPLEIEAELELNRMSHNKPLRFALERPVSLSPESHGSWSQEGDLRIWRIHLVSPAAHSLGLVFGRYELLPGVKLFVYDPEQKRMKGAFTWENNKSSGLFPVGHIPGEELIIELQVPAGLVSYGELELQSLSHAFLDTGFKATAASCPAGEFGCSQACEIDVNCLEGDDWWQVKPSVIRVYTTTYYCTGVLVNNSSYDGTPYVLTAEHCLNDKDPEHDKANVSVFQFNYESAACFGEDGPLDMSIASAELRVCGDSLDFSLVELSEIPPASYKAYYAGWDRSDLQLNSTVTLHHPWGDVKKISIDEDAPSIPTRPGDVPYLDLKVYHYFSYWWIKRWDVGSTEGGSSGGPLFNQARRVIGTLSGGNAACGDSIGYDPETERVIYSLAPNYDDYFTRFGMSWDYEMGKGKALRTWLDPAGTNPVTLNGYNPSSTGVTRILPERRFRLSPNPAGEFLYITSLMEPTGRGSYQLIDLSGAVRMRGTLDGAGGAQVPLGSLPPGIYLVRLEMEGYLEHQKLMVSGL